MIKYERLAKHTLILKPITKRGLHKKRDRTSLFRLLLLTQALPADGSMIWDEGTGDVSSQLVALPLSKRPAILMEQVSSLSYNGVPYVLKSIPWAKLVDCPNIATTDGLKKPSGFSDKEALELMKRAYGIIVETAEIYEININIEVHGYFTTNPDLLDEMLNFVKSDRLGLNLDTGNSFIAGQDPVEFCRRFIDKVKHVHIKDVSKDLADAMRGKDTGIGISHSAIGDGVNADNIRKIIAMLRDHGYSGTLSMECEGTGGPLIEKSLRWLRKTLSELGIEEEK